MNLTNFEDVIFKLERATSIISLIQTAAAEGSCAISEEDMSNALYEICLQQQEITKELRKIHSEARKEVHKNN